jgi:hypothetical protein
MGTGSLGHVVPGGGGGLSEYLFPPTAIALRGLTPVVRLGPSHSCNLMFKEMNREFHVRLCIRLDGKFSRPLTSSKCSPLHTVQSEGDGETFVLATNTAFTSSRDRIKAPNIHCQYKLAPQTMPRNCTVLERTCQTMTGRYPRALVNQPSSLVILQPTKGTERVLPQDRYTNGVYGTREVIEPTHSR